MSGYSIFSDHPLCSRVVLDGSMMIQEVYDIGQMRSWYFADLFRTRSPIFVQGPVWGLFSEMQRVFDIHSTGEIFHDPLFRTSFYGFQWDTYTTGAGNIAHELDLLGSDVVPGSILKPGSPLAVTLYWSIQQVPKADYQGYVKLVSADYTRVLSAVDDMPTAPFKSMLVWRKDQVVVGRTYVLAIPPDIPPGEYALITGMYALENGQAVALPHIDRATGAPLPFIVLRNYIIK